MLTTSPDNLLYFNTVGINSGLIGATGPLPTQLTTFILPPGPNLYLVNYGLANATASPGAPITFALSINGVATTSSMLTVFTDPDFDTLVSTSVIFQTGAAATNLSVQNIGAGPALVGGVHFFPFTGAYISITKLN